MNAYPNQDGLIRRRKRIFIQQKRQRYARLKNMQKRIYNSLFLQALQIISITYYNRRWQCIYIEYINYIWYRYKSLNMRYFSLSVNNLCREQDNVIVKESNKTTPVVLCQPMLPDYLIINKRNTFAIQNKHDLFIIILYKLTKRKSLIY